MCRVTFNFCVVENKSNFFVFRFVLSQVPNQTPRPGDTIFSLFLKSPEAKEQGEGNFNPFPDNPYDLCLNTSNSETNGKIYLFFCLSLLQYISKFLFFMIFSKLKRKRVFGTNQTAGISTGHKLDLPGETFRDQQ